MAAIEFEETIDAPIEFEETVLGSAPQPQPLPVVTTTPEPESIITRAIKSGFAEGAKEKISAQVAEIIDEFKKFGGRVQEAAPTRRLVLGIEWRLCRCCC